MKHLIATLTTFGILGMAASGWAQDTLPTAGEAMGHADASDVVYKQETSYDFEADDVEGDIYNPYGEDIEPQQHGKTSSLISIRADFVGEMIRSVEDT